jgi:hypothetical protein
MDKPKVKVIGLANIFASNVPDYVKDAARIYVGHTFMCVHVFLQKLDTDTLETILNNIEIVTHGKDNTPVKFLTILADLVAQYEGLDITSESQSRCVYFMSGVVGEKMRRMGIANISMYTLEEELQPDLMIKM